jgi:hypothetical protein
MYAESSTVLRAVVADFFFNYWYLEIPLDNRIRHVPRCVHYYAQGLQLEMFQNFYVESGSRTPELYPLSPNWFDYIEGIYLGLNLMYRRYPGIFMETLS